MIHAVLVFNNDGKPRLAKYYQTPHPALLSSASPSSLKHHFQRSIYSLTTHHQNHSATARTNFINLTPALLALLNRNSPSSPHFFQLHPEYLHLDLCLVYRNYATLFFVFLIDNSESQLAILDLIQVFVESLDKCFKNVCELDLIFNYDKLDLLLNQIILGGIVLDTSVDSIIANFQAQLKVLNNSRPSSAFPTS